MCANTEGCFLIQTYRQSLSTHGPDEALRKAAQLYRRTNTQASDEEATEFVRRFVVTETALACSACG